MAASAKAVREAQAAETGDLLLLSNYSQYHYEIMWLELLRLNVLEQVRKTYTRIAELANDMAGKGMMHPIQVAYLTPARARAYLKMTNRVWETSYTLGHLRPLPGGRHYAIVITGHRRVLAHMHLWYTGCDECLETHGPERPGVCYARHPQLRRGLVEAKAYTRISPAAAMEVQCTENIHNSVPAHEQADAYERMFAVRLMDDPELTVAKFARSMGCDPDTVRRARRYCRLPDRIRDDVEQRHFGYGVALELGRFQEALGPSPATMEAWRLRVIQDRMTVKRLKGLIDERLRNERSGRHMMFSDDELNPAEVKARRSVFERRRVAALHGFAAYFAACAPLLADGTMGPNGRYLDTSTRKLLLQNLDVLESVLPDLRMRAAEARLAALSREMRDLVGEIDQLEAPGPLVMQ